MASEILVTNDDGIRAPALDVLCRALSEHGRVTVVAPEREMSAQSHAITLNQPLRYRELPSRRFAVDGTPADCVILARFRIFSEPPDLIVSGINRGKNIGDGIMYSGTVAAACEGTLHGIPSIAVSAEYSEEIDYDAAGECTGRVARRVLAAGLPPGVLLNLNLPSTWNGRVLLTRQGEKAGKSLLIENLDSEEGPETVWLHQGMHKLILEMEGDLPADDEAMEQGYASLTPLQLDRTASRYFRGLSEWKDLFDSPALNRDPS